MIVTAKKSGQSSHMVNKFPMSFFLYFWSVKKNLKNWKTYTNASKNDRKNNSLPIFYTTKYEYRGYRYFFNGQEGDNEVFGEVANFGYEFWQYDNRLGRWWSVDPKWNCINAISYACFPA